MARTRKRGGGAGTGKGPTGKAPAPSVAAPKGAPDGDAGQRLPMIGFRLGEPHYGRLADEARELGVSVHALARAHLIRALAQEDALLDVREELAGTRIAVENLHAALAAATEQVLATLVQPEDGGPPDERTLGDIREWVTEHVGRAEP